MKRAWLVLSAAALDWGVGDPEGWHHPVRLMGKAIAAGEGMLHPEREPQAERVAGVELVAGGVLTGAVVLLSYALPKLLLRILPRRASVAVEVVLASTTLAARNLDDEARSILAALEQGNLLLARQRLARVVGRDTGALDEAGVCRALIETLAESLADGIVAPLFYLAIGGVPAAMAFKAVSTMDSMIGHRTTRYLYFGRAAARLDDAANFLPARLTGLALVALAPRAAGTFLRDRYRHPSPNAGHPEAAMAGALGVQLGGPSTYEGEPHRSPLLHAGARLPGTADARRALQLTRAVAVLAALGASAVLYATGRRRR